MSSLLSHDIYQTPGCIRRPLGKGQRRSIERAAWPADRSALTNRHNGPSRSIASHLDGKIDYSLARAERVNVV